MKRVLLILSVLMLFGCQKESVIYKQLTPPVVTTKLVSIHSNTVIVMATLASQDSCYRGFILSQDSIVNLNDEVFYSP